MEKNTLKKIILENQSRILGLQIVKRDYSVESNANYIFTGQRRVGKTYFVLNLVQELINQGLPLEAVLHINFEDERLIGLDVTELDEILESYQELFPHRPVLFFDEIQNIPGWQKFARRMADTGFKIYITGSNSEMLSGEMASTLGGRFMVMEIETLSFKELLLFHKVELNENIEFSPDRFNVIRLFDSYFSGGGFPELFKFNDKKEYLSNIFQKIFLGDIVSRYQIRNPFAMKLLIKKLAESAMDEVSFNRMRNIIVSTGVQIGTTTVIEYVKYLENSFLVSSLENYNAKISSRESKKKYYFKDNGLLSLFLSDPPSFQLETLVFNTLRIVYKSNLFYLRNGYKVDFFVPNETLIQVCFSLDEPATRLREITALLKAQETHSVKSMTIITYSAEETVIEQGLTINIVPIWKWILKFNT